MAEHTCPHCGAAPSGPSKDDLLRHYMDKPVQRFAQLDGFVDTHIDSVMSSDFEGDSIMSGATHELMRSPGRGLPVRVLIHEDANPDDVKRLLRKMLEHVDRCVTDLHAPVETPF